jgi:outer membrane biosynthesis protein TonB
MDEKVVEQILDELYSSLEDAETRSTAVLLFLKEQGIASEEKLAPYFDQAGKASDVRWRAARVRMGSLLASAMKSPEPSAPKQPADQGSQKTAGAAPEDKKTQPTEKTQDEQAPEQNASQDERPAQQEKSGEGQEKSAQPSEQKSQPTAEQKPRDQEQEKVVASKPTKKEVDQPVDDRTRRIPTKRSA